MSSALIRFSIAGGFIAGAFGYVTLFHLAAALALLLALAFALLSRRWPM